MVDILIQLRVRERHFLMLGQKMRVFCFWVEPLHIIIFILSFQCDFLMTTDYKRLIHTTSFCKPLFGGDCIPSHLFNQLLRKVLIALFLGVKSVLLLPCQLFSEKGVMCLCPGGWRSRRVLACFNSWKVLFTSLFVHLPASMERGMSGEQDTGSFWVLSQLV